MNKSIKISCKNLWQLFGKGATDFLDKHHHNPSDADLESAGLIAAVRDVSFDVYAGEILVIMGLSGSGKSTLVRGLTRLLEPNAGQVLFDGIDLLQASRSSLTDIRRRKMGMVFQSFGLLPHRTVLDNIAFPLEIQNVPKAARLAKAQELVATVGLEGREHNFPSELSGGQQQRVGIARSLIGECDVWFLDEPFSALDPLIRREMQDEFVSLQSRLNKSIVFVTHDFDEAVRLGDRIAIMKDGRLAQIGTAEELLMTPADDYVKKFVQHAPRAKLITAQKIMVPANPGDINLAGSQITIKNTDVLEKIAKRVIEADQALPVVDAAGIVVGQVNREHLARALFQ
ncbi:glycine betaine/L-proline ABC transporter ATP-binding protein [Pusillimonas sp. ANT_WB101]|uniref:quaternary amine ABC transporter ATP-binding protein n=1 Tax=Pusillimonas sp. ANT_WB101 TaxID=2597356 RepID=UPI0011EC042C|nr:betaine/proline/choline family ABC transporter ATP-binding protein [Pusillimonas sp. ANT_WB101]KAA0911133.1 betaine/proline/choline family ABC transporter ATP-binding protein [Pusillimonas sp. ANT_WB101]